MIKSKIIPISASALLLSQFVLASQPAYIAEAKSTADVWPYAKANTSADFKSKAGDSSNERVSVHYYNKSSVPLYFNFTSQHNGGYYASKYIGLNLQNKGIQYVSFIDSTSILGIGIQYTGKSAYEVAMLRYNEIRKIYWNSDYAYSNFTIYPYTFANNKLQNLDLPKALISIKKGVFYSNEITWIKGWDNITELGESAFESNKLVSELNDGYKFTIPSKISIINRSTFYDNQLTYVKVPANINTVSEYAFGNNPITGIFFDNQNVAISDNALSSYEGKKPEGPVTVYGHGETSTAKKFADNNGFEYVNVDEVESAVFDAEQAKTQSKLDEAYALVNPLSEGEIKDGYLKRLDELDNYFNTELLVSKTESSLLRPDYDAAVNSVKKLNTTSYINAYNNRLNEVLKKIEKQRLNEINYFLETNKDIIDLEKLNELKKEGDDFKTLTSSEKQILSDSFSNLEDTAKLNSYKFALSYINFAEKYPNFKNVFEAQKYINVLPDGYKVLEEDYRYTITEEFMFDSDGNKIINEEESYKKTDNVNYDKDASGNYILKDVLTEPVYMKNVDYGKEFIVTKETGSKTFLQNKLDEFDEEVYSETAIALAEKELTQASLDDALIITLNLKDSTKKDDLLSKVNDIQVKIDNLIPLKEEADYLINLYDKEDTKENYEEALASINKFTHEGSKREYKIKLNNITYKNKTESLIRNSETKGLSDEERDQLLVYLSLLSEDTEGYDELNLKSEAALNEASNYYNVYKEISSEIDSIDKGNKNSLTTQRYEQIREDIYNVKANNTYKDALLEKLSLLYKDLEKLQTQEQSSKILFEEIDYLNTIPESISINDLESLFGKISTVDNAVNRGELKEEYDQLIENIFTSTLFPGFLESKNTTYDYKSSIEEYLKLITNSNTKSSLKNTLYESLENEISKKIQDENIEKIISGNLSNYDSSLEELISLTPSSSQQKLKEDLDNKFITYVTNNYKTTGDTYINPAKENLVSLSKIYDSISDPIKKQTLSTTINETVKNYFNNTYPDYNNPNNTYTTAQLTEMKEILNNFSDDSITSVSRESIDNSIYNSIKVNNSSDSNSFKKENISDKISDITYISDVDLKKDLYEKFYNDFKSYLASLDPKNQTTLKTLQNLSKDIESVNNITKNDLDLGDETNKEITQIFSTYLSDNKDAIFETSLENGSNNNILEFLGSYLGEDEINSLNTIGSNTSSNNDKKSITNNYYYNNSNDTKNNSNTSNSTNNQSVQRSSYSSEQNTLSYYKGIISSLEANVAQLSASMTKLEALLASQNNLNGSSFSLSNMNDSEYKQSLLRELGLEEELTGEEYYGLIQTLQDEIKKLKEGTDENILGNVIALKSAAIENDEDIKKQIASYKEGNKNFNNILIAAGSSMWLLILLGLMYSANLNLRNKKLIESTSKETQDKIDLTNDKIDLATDKIDLTNDKLETINIKIEEIVSAIKKYDSKEK